LNQALPMCPDACYRCTRLLSVPLSALSGCARILTVDVTRRGASLAR
jgi:hypothetical protein